MDDLQNLSSEAIDAQVQNALGYKPKQSKTTDANLGNIRPVGSNNEFLQTQELFQIPRSFSEFLDYP